MSYKTTRENNSEIKKLMQNQKKGVEKNPHIGKNPKIHMEAQKT